MRSHVSLELAMVPPYTVFPELTAATRKISSNAKSHVIVPFSQIIIVCAPDQSPF